MITCFLSSSFQQVHAQNNSNKNTTILTIDRVREKKSKNYIIIYPSSVKNVHQSRQYMHIVHLACPYRNYTATLKEIHV